MDADRNALLRRVDWRFVSALGPRAPARAVVAAGGDLAAGVRLFANPVDSADQASLVVAVNPSQRRLRELVSCLDSGGVCYTEWWPLLPSAPARIRRRLERAGLVDVRAYWCWPSPSRAAFWLPVDRPATLRRFLDGRASAESSPRARVRGRLVRAAWDVILRTGLAQPLRVTARVPDRTLTANRDDVLKHVRQQWWEWGLGPEPATLGAVLLTAGRRAINKAVLLVAAEPDGTPRVAVKMPRVAEARTGLSREAYVLSTLHARHADHLHGVPRVLFFDPVTSSLAETIVVGEPVVRHLRPATFEHFAVQGTAWLQNLAVHTPLQPRDAWWPHVVEPVLRAFERDWQTVIAREHLQVTCDHLSRLGALPVVCEQRDFAPWNVLYSADNGLAVVDWESAEVDGLPLLDLVYFLSYLVFFVAGSMRSGRYVESYRASLDPSTRLGRVRAECIRRYCEAAGVPAEAVPALSMLTWMLHAQSEYRRLREDAGGGDPHPAALQSALFVQLWQAEVQRCAA